MTEVDLLGQTRHRWKHTQDDSGDQTAPVAAVASDWWTTAKAQTEPVYTSDNVWIAKRV